MTADVDYRIPYMIDGVKTNQKKKYQKNGSGNLPGKDEEDGTGGGAAAHETSPEAETLCDAVYNRLTDKKKPKRRQSVHRRCICGVYAVCFLVVLIGNHLGLPGRRGRELDKHTVLTVNKDLRKKKKKREGGVGGAYSATTSFRANGEDEGNEM